MQTSVETIKELMKLAQSKDKLQSQLEKINSEIADLLANLTSGKIASSVAPSPKKAIKPTPSTKRKRYGDLSNKIITALEAAGAQGVKISDLAKKIGVKNVNVHAWFSSTGKDRTERVGRGCYRLKQPQQQSPQEP